MPKEAQPRRSDWIEHSLDHGRGKLEAIRAEVGYVIDGDPLPDEVLNAYIEALESAVVGVHAAMAGRPDRA
jgi:hypothetical protein